MDKFIVKEKDELYNYLRNNLNKSKNNIKSLLKNECIYVNNNVVKIRGNTNLEPPIGINVKVVQETMVVRGDIKNVKIDSEEPAFSADNGVLTIDDGMNECPFDEFNAEVRDGRLIIKKHFSDIEIKE